MSATRENSLALLASVTQPLSALTAVPGFQHTSQRPRRWYPSSLVRRIGKWRTESSWMGVSTLPGFFRLQYSPMSSLASCSRNSKIVLRPVYVAYNSKELYVSHCDSPTLGGEMLTQNESIRYGHIEQKVEHITVELLRLCAAAVIASELVPSVNTAHELVVGDYGRWTGITAQVPSFCIRSTSPTPPG